MFCNNVDAVNDRAEENVYDNGTSQNPLSDIHFECGQIRTVAKIDARAR